MVIVHRTEEYISHSGTKGMKWGYNDGQRNGKRTAAELKKVAAEKAKLNGGKSSADFEGDYHEANNMLKYLGITLDLQSDDAAARTMAVYEQMRDTKDNYKTQYDWLNAFSQKLAGVGYDMKAVDDYLLQNKEKLNEIKVGSGSGNREKSNQDWADNDPKKNKSKSSSKKKSGSEESTPSSGNGGGDTKLRQEINAHKDKRTGKVKEEKKKKKGTPSSSYVRKSTKVIGGYDAYGTKHSAMMNESPSEYFEHYGTKGMHWGTRLYQNPDGSLTPLGRARYGSKENYENAKRYKVERKQNKVDARNKKIDDKLKKKYDIDQEDKKSYSKSNRTDADRALDKKRVKDLTDEELNQRINRLRLEQSYKQLNEQLNPEVKSKGQKFKEGFNEVAVQVLKNSAKAAGTALLTQWMKDKGADLIGVELGGNSGGGKASQTVANTVNTQLSKGQQRLNKKAEKAAKKAEIASSKAKKKEANQRVIDARNATKDNREQRRKEGELKLELMRNEATNKNTPSVETKNTSTPAPAPSLNNISKPNVSTSNVDIKQVIDKGYELANKFTESQVVNKSDAALRGKAYEEQLRKNEDEFLAEILRKKQA